MQTVCGRMERRCAEQRAQNENQGTTGGRREGGRKRLQRAPEGTKGWLLGYFRVWEDSPLE